MASTNSFDLNSINKALSDPNRTTSGVDFSGKSLKLDTEKDAQPIVDAINKCPDLQYLTLTGNTLGVAAAEAIAKALEHHPELKICKWSDMFTGRMKTEIPPALKALGDGMIAAGARLQVLDLSDNAFGPIGVEGLAKLLESEVCSQLQELRLNNNGLGITGGRLLARALKSCPRCLKVFIAGRNRLENDGAKALADVFQNMGTLEEVAMPQNGIYHVGITALSEAFKSNPQLSCLNLNDNTIGAKGAEAIANALPSLKNLKAINFGDCLLKSKGARALAKAFKEHSQKLESLDLSHNEIGREACMDVVDSITSAPGSADRLARIVLAGNSLGNASNKKTIREKLGACAELSDGEGSDDDEYVTDSEEEVESEEEDESEQDSGDESTQINETADIVKDITLDTSVVEGETIVERFLREPTIENFDKLGPNAADLIEKHLESITDPAQQIPAYVDATLCVWGVPIATKAATQLSRALLRLPPRESLPLADCLLRATGLIKSEDKQYKPRWRNPACLTRLGELVQDQACPEDLRNTVHMFLRRDTS